MDRAIITPKTRLIAVGVFPAGHLQSAFNIDLLVKFSSKPLYPLSGCHGCAIVDRDPAVWMLANPCVGLDEGLEGVLTHAGYPLSAIKLPISFRINSQSEFRPSKL
jgi:hypothetical protein